MRTHRIHAVTLLLLLSVSLCVGAQVPSDIKGRLKQIDGTPVLLMWGTPSERGVAEGYLLGEKIVAGFKGFALSKSIVPMPKLWGTFLKPLIETRMTVPSRVKMHAMGIIEGIRRRDPKLLRVAELERDLNAEDICALASLPDVAGFFCSSFAVLPKSTADGNGIVVGRNLDYMASQSLLNAFVIRVHAPDGERNGWLDIGYAGLPGCLTGFSDAGAYVAIHDVHVRSDPKAKGMTPRLIALQDLMESFRPARKSAAVAVKQLSAFSYAMGGNAMLAWDKPASNMGACVLEFGPATGDEPPAVARSMGQEGFVACSNHFRLRSSPQRCRRFNSIITSLALGKPITTAHAWEVIESASVRGTLYRLIADLRSGEVQLDRRLKPRTKAYAPRLSFNYRALLHEASEAASQGIAPASAQEPADTTFWDSVFSENHVLDIRVEVSREGWDAMQPAARSRGRGGRRGRDEGDRQHRGSRYTYTRARVTIDGQQFDDAGLRFKGNSSFRNAGSRLKKPFKIDLNRFTKGQKLHGRTKLNLSNSFLDPAFMKEKLGYELYRAAGLPTPGVGWATLTLTIGGVADPIPLGIYVLVEQVDRRFLASNLGEASKDSLLMKPEVEDWHYIDDDAISYRSYNIKSGEENTEQLRAFASLLKLIERASDTEFERAIGERMDLKQLAGYLAATSILGSLDSYVGMPHNYYLLMDKADGKMRILPWDINEAFGTFTMPGDAEDLVRWDIDRPWVGRRRLLERLFASESFPKLYRAALARLMKQAFTKDLLFKRIAEFEKVLSPHVAKSDKIFWLAGSTLKHKPTPHIEGLHMGIDGDPAGLNRAVRRKILSIKPFVLRRIESIKAQLAGKSEGKTLGRGRRR